MPGDRLVPGWRAAERLNRAAVSTGMTALAARGPTAMSVLALAGSRRITDVGG